MTNPRQNRVGEAIRHALAELLSRGAARDPLLRENSITVTEVRISPDLKNATAFIMPLGGKDLGTVVEALNHAAPFFRGQVAQRVQLRHAPRLSFVADESFSYADKIDRILHAPEVAKDLTPNPASQGPAPEETEAAAEESREESGDAANPEHGNRQKR